MDALEALAPYRALLARRPEDVAVDLDRYVALLRKWNRSHNLVSRETGHDDLWLRHIVDSLQVLKFLRESDTRLVDVGSGGGFPAVPLAIASGDRRAFTLVEPSAKKASFLKTVSRTLGLGLTVDQRRVESLASEAAPPPDVITSRALASLPRLLELTAPFFGAAGVRAILHKGREHVDELVESRAVWQFDVIEHPSDTNASGVLLEISNLRLRHK